jgi:hypothetical protein
MSNDKEDSDLARLVETVPDAETRLTAAIAYGEASVDEVVDEIAGIAHAVANRAKAWRKTVPEMIAADPGYSYATNGKNVRFNLLMKSTLDSINRSRAMRLAVNSAAEALAGKGMDPSGGAFWWDGIDLKDYRQENSRIKLGFKYGAESHNIFSMSPIKKTVIKYWQIKNKVTDALVDSTERGRFDYVYVSTAAHGKTIFWRYTQDYVGASGAKEYK